jgi:hypothetical protein
MDEQPKQPRRISLLDVAAVVFVGLFAVGVFAWIVYTLSQAFSIGPRG